MTTLAGDAGPAPTRLDAALADVRATAHDVRMVIGSQERGSGRSEPIVIPHEHRETLRRVHYAAAADVTDAIETAIAARADWSLRSPEQHAEPFLRAADLLEAGPWRDLLIAATMLELSKTVGEAEGDAAETVDFLRANVANAARMATVQPHSPPGVTNRVEYRPLWRDRRAAVHHERVRRAAGGWEPHDRSREVGDRPGLRWRSGPTTVGRSIRPGGRWCPPRRPSARAPTPSPTSDRRSDISRALR